jgi:hypothetical protein
MLAMEVLEPNRRLFPDHSPPILHGAWVGVGSIWPQTYANIAGKIWTTAATELLTAQYVTLQNYFSYPSLVLPIAPIKLKLGLQIRGRHLVANHLDQVIKQGATLTQLRS